MRHIIPAEDWESEMDSAVHGLLPDDGSVVNTKANAKLAAVPMLCVWEKSLLKESASAVEQRQRKN